MNIKNVNNSMFSADYLEKLRFNHVDKRQEVDRILTGNKGGIKKYNSVGAEKEFKIKLDRAFEMRHKMLASLHEAFVNGNDPIKAVFNSYDKIKNIISGGSLSDAEKEGDYSVLDKEFKFCAEWFANTICEKFYFAGVKTDPKNEHSKIYNGIDLDKLNGMRMDIRKMFQNAKDYYHNAGSLENITTGIIEGDTNSITFKDLTKMSSILKSLENMNASFDNIVQDKKSSGGGIDKAEYKILSDYINEKANKLSISSFTKGLYLDCFF
ncbi:hypothetical protein [Fusibacter ferrireducens]|uniref:Uncharacterized protein n=1 Tax=Fusibacter ferrireducens TaxID=2785058 RepID=A0ABR9ZTI1_9FIRM|nr:hypothetical protein [Fusibacter ferrireducens]MBF4693752.1 hypothetical protein [Fusibacter ferrireducens]